MSAANPATAIDLQAPGTASTIARKILNAVLFITITTSFLAFIEPSPHDLMMFVLLVACVAARVPFDRKLVPLFALTIIWLIGGGLALIQVGDDEKAIQYFGTSVYLGFAAVMFACLFSGGDLTRLLIVRRAYIFAAVLATVAGYIGYFHLLPGSDALLSDGRIRATFKDPNVYGPFLVYPLVLMIVEALGQRIRLLSVVLIAFLSSGLFLAFSRGAWMHFAVSAPLAIAILFVAAQNLRLRARIVIFTVIILCLIGVILVALTSIDSIHTMLVERAKVIQPYDVGTAGRFGLQQLAITSILENPNGMGPFAFSNAFGGQQHDVYMQGFLVYGWLGGAAYLALVFVTLFVGLTTLRQNTPWQPYLIAAYASFVGEAVEGIIIDSDHWRHFFLLLGLVWGLSVANMNVSRTRAHAALALRHAY